MSFATTSSMRYVPASGRFAAGLPPSDLTHHAQPGPSRQPISPSPSVMLDEDSPEGVRACLCGTRLEDAEDLYCSTACARSDALSSLCFKEQRNSQDSQITLHHIRLGPAPPTRTSGHRRSHTYNSSISSISSLTFSNDSHQHAHAGAAASGTGSVLEPALTSAPEVLMSAAANASAASCAAASSFNTGTGSSVGVPVEWSASHYRRVAHEDMRREERREERRKRRRERSVVSGTSSIARVPDLVGGSHYHSRNSSVTTTASTLSSTRTSFASSISSGFSSLSRNPSTPRSQFGSLRDKKSARPPGFAGIMESDEGEDWMENILPEVAETHVKEDMDVFSAGYSARTGARAPTPSSMFRPSKVARTAKNKNATALQTIGLGADMRDVLDEILKMEQGFVIESETEQSDHLVSPDHRRLSISARRTSTRASKPSQPPIRFSSAAAPTTPPTALIAHKRDSSNPPGAPLRAGHYSRDLDAPPSPSFPIPQGRRASQSQLQPMNKRLSRHMPTMSEPFAVYSPHPPAMMAQPPSSPVRRSLTFTPTVAAEVARSYARRPPSLLISQADAMQVETPPAFLRRPSADPSRSGSPATNRRRMRVDSTDSVLRFQFPKSNNVTPVRPRFANEDSLTPRLSSEPEAMAQPPRLQPSLFPSSPCPNGESSFPSPPLRAPSSGFRLGVLCGSGHDEDSEMSSGDSPQRDNDLNDFVPVFYDEASLHSSSW